MNMMKVSEAAKEWGISEKEIWHLIEQGKLKTYEEEGEIFVNSDIPYTNSIANAESKKSVDVVSGEQKREELKNNTYSMKLLKSIGAIIFILIVIVITIALGGKDDTIVKVEAFLLLGWLASIWGKNWP